MNDIVGITMQIEKWALAILLMFLYFEIKWWFLYKRTEK